MLARQSPLSGIVSGWEAVEAAALERCDSQAKLSKALKNTELHCMSSMFTHVHLFFNGFSSVFHSMAFVLVMFLCSLSEGSRLRAMPGWNCFEPIDQVDTTAPPGGAVIVVQWPGALNASLDTRATKRKPSCLAMLDDQRWSDFANKLIAIVERFSNEFWLEVAGAAVILGLMFAAGVMSITNRDEYVAWGIYAAAAVLLLGSIFIVRCFNISRNLSRDKEIEELCDQLAPSM